MSLPIGLPQFATIHLAGFESKLRDLLKNNLEQIENLLKENHHYTWENLIYPLDDLDDKLEHFWAPLSHLHSVMDSKELRDCYEACLPQLSLYESAIAHNQTLYKAIQSIDRSELDQAQQKIIEDELRNFELSGVALSNDKKKRFEAISKRLSELSNQFQTNVLDAVSAFSIHLKDASRLVGLPEHALESAKELAAEKGLPGFILNLEYPCYQAVVTYADDRALREEIYQAYVTRASDEGPNAKMFDNTQLIDELLSLRHEKANLLGFKNYAELSIDQKMAESTSQVIDFINDLIDRVYKQAQTELEDLKQFAKKEYQLAELKPWDLAFLSEKRRKALFNLTQEELRPYFPLPKVLEGLFSIINKLYGMSIEEVKGVDIWHKDVRCYCILDEHKQVRGYIYTDLFARPNKRGGAWMDSLQTRRKLADGHIEFPIATLTCNFAKAAPNQVALLSHEEVTTLFHEFGHCLHHVLTQVDYISAAGINGVEWDGVELPSQFFENWAWEEGGLALLTAHIQTGEALPKDVFKQMTAAKNFHSALSILRQMEFALFDFRIHQAFKPNQDKFVTDILEEVRAKTNILPKVLYNRFQHSFTHIFAGGYAAGYYSYSWAEVLSSDAFARFEEEGLFNPKTGRDFLSNILEVGGTKPAAEAYKAFKGREATLDAYLRHNGIGKS